MSDGEAFLNWCDQLTVEVRGVWEREAKPHFVYRATFDDPRWSRGQASEALIEARFDLGPPGDRFFLEERRSYLSWGADASAAAVVLTMAEWGAQVIVGAVAMGALSRLWTLVPRSDRSVVEAEQVSRDEAEARCRWAITEAFTLGHDDSALRLVSEHEDRTARAWRFGYLGGDDRFEVELSAPTDEVPAVVRIERTAAT